MLKGLVLAVALASGDAPLDDPGAEARAQALMNEIRCVACENEPISHSASEIARDMRRTVREQVGAGASDEEVRQWFAQRYGEFVLFRPSSKGAGVLLWLLPALLLAIAVIVVGLYFRPRRSRPDPVP